ncbi:MAG: hypothetical protein MJZ61_00050 [Bacteroidales bacterium]|nr:hypothetical protein [Bacteroidales bacterium]
MIEMHDIEKAYPSIWNSGLPVRRFGYQRFLDVLDSHCGGSVVLVEECRSFEGRPIRVLRFGHGPNVVLAWSQMHGNEPVSTLALMDVISLMAAGYVDYLAESVTVYMVPLLNPDGHIRNDRRNAQGIDINRDAQDMVSPEACLLMRLARSLNPRYALNLHDQELYYTTRPRLLQTSLALLAPEFSFQTSESDSRTRSMMVCGAVAEYLQESAPDRIAKYQDTYTPTAFGDTFMRMGISSVLIESGAVAGDCERASTRRLVYLAIMKAIMVISGRHPGKLEAYNSLPLNMRNNAFDLKLRNLRICGPGYDYRLDIGIRRIKPSHNVEDFTDDSPDYRIVNIGNLSGNGAIVDFDASGYQFAEGYSGIHIGRQADFHIVDQVSSNMISVKSLLNF